MGNMQLERDENVDSTRNTGISDGRQKFGIVKLFKYIQGEKR